MSNSNLILLVVLVVVFAIIVFSYLHKQGGRIKMRSPPKVLTGNFRPSQLSFFLS